MNRPLRELLLAELAGELRGGTAVDWAVAELERGVDTPATRVLAGLGASCSLSEVEPYFASALAERGVARPVDENGLRRGQGSLTPARPARPGAGECGLRDRGGFTEICLDATVICMRTTLDLEDRLFRAAKARAAERGETLTSFVESALRERLREGRKSGKPFRFRPLTKRGRVPPAVDVADRDALYEWMEGRR